MPKDGPFEVITKAADDSCVSFHFNDFDSAAEHFANGDSPKNVALIFDSEELNGRSLAQFTHLYSDTKH